MSLHGRRLRVGAFDYRVQSDKKSTEILSVANASGACRQDELIIDVEPKNAPGVQVETLFHEAFHAIWSQTYLDYDYPDGAADSVGEKMIAELSPRIVAFLRDNPWFVKKIQETF